MATLNDNGSHSSLAPLCSYRVQHGNSARSLKPTSSFVVVNHKKSWRPPPFILFSLFEFFPGRVPLSFATCTPAVRLFTEGSGSEYTAQDGLCVEGYSVSRVLTDPFVAPCDEGGVVEDDTAPHASGSLRHSTSGSTRKGGADGTDELAEPLTPEDSFTQAYPLFATGASSSRTRQSCSHAYPHVGYHDGRNRQLGLHRTIASSLGDGGIGSGPWRSTSARGTDTDLATAADGSGTAGVGLRQRPPSGAGSSSPPSSAPGGLVAAAVAELQVCESRCWHAGVHDLCLCRSVHCTSTAGLRMVLRSAWWLTRYLGISLTVEGLRQREQFELFKEITRTLSVVELVCVRCTLSHEWMQSVSTCSDLIALTVAFCAAESEAPLMYVNSILAKSGGPDKQRPPGQSKWYIAGNLSVGVLRKLRCLHLVQTPLQQEFMESLPDCASGLECLMLHRCRGVTSVEPLERLPALRCFSLQNSSIEDRGLQPIGHCAKLQRLYLVECRRLNSLGFCLKDVRNSLRQMTLAHNWFAEEHMHHLASCERLQELNLYGLKRLASIAPLAAIENLEVLNLGDTSVTTVGCEDALRSMRLSRINLSLCAGLTSVSSWTSTRGGALTSLDLSSTGIDDEGLSGLYCCASLRYLNLSNCPRLTSVQGLSRLSGLRWVSLAGNAIADEDVLQHLSTPAMRHVRYLSLADCPDIRQLGFLKYFRSLLYLDLDSTSVNDASVDAVGQYCAKLKQLTVSRCLRVTRLCCLGRLAALRELNASHTAITASGLSGLEGCRSLEVVLLRSCRQLTSLHGLQVLPQLRELCVDHYSGAGSAALHLTQGPSSPQSQAQRTPSPNTPVEETSNAGSVGFTHSRAHSTRSMSSLASSSSNVGVLPPALPSPRFGVVRDPVDAEGSRTIASPVTGNASVTTLPSVDRARRTPPARMDSVGNRSTGSTTGLLAGNTPNPEAVVELCTVESLSVRKSALTESGLSALVFASSHLRHLDVSECRFLTDLSGLGNPTGLCELVAAKCTGLGNTAVYHISQLPALQRLVLTGCREVTDLTPLGQLAQLEEIDAAYSRVTDEGLYGLVHCRALKRVSLAECRYVTSVAPLGSLPSLRELHLESTAVNNAGIAALTQCAALERLYLTKCRQITDVSELLSAPRQLEVLDVYGTSIPTRIAGEPRPYACTVM